MTPLETILAFVFAMGILAIPIVAIITRKGSAVGQAIGRRIAAREAIDDETVHASLENLRDTVVRQQKTIEDQQSELTDLREKLQFMQRLLEAPGEKRSTE